MIGASLNEYRIAASIGAGGMGEVFRALDTRLSRDVASRDDRDRRSLLASAARPRHDRRREFAEDKTRP